MKKRTTIYLSEGMANVVKIKNINLSKWVEEKLIETFGNHSSLEELNREIIEAERAVAKLREVRNTLEGETALVENFVMNMESKIKDGTNSAIKNPKEALAAYRGVVQGSPVLSAVGVERLERMVSKRISGDYVVGYE